MNSRKSLVRISLLTLYLLGFGNNALSQPYNFYFKEKYFSLGDNPHNSPGGYTSDIYRFNFATGNTELLLSDAGRITQIFDSPDQNRLILQNRSQVVIVELNNSDKRTILLEGVQCVYQVIFTPRTNRFYVSIGSSDYYQKTIVFDYTTFQPIDTLTGLYSYEPICISQDQSKAYISISDSNGLVFQAWDIIANKSLPIKKFTSLGSFAYEPGIDDAESGLALVKYERIAERGFENEQYVVCNVDHQLIFTPFAFPWRSEGYLSSDGKYAIIEQVNYDTTRESAEYHTGIVYVFDASAGKLMQRVTLPPNGKILVFQSYPQMFYYYNDSTNQSIPINVTTVTPTETLLDTLISLKHQAVAKGWLKDGRSYQKDCDEIMRDRDWYRRGEFSKYSRWKPDENWDFDRDWNTGIVRVLDRRIDRAKDALVRGDSVKARKDLEIFVMEIELLNNINRKLEARRQAPLLTLDGYTLLKFNAEYLIDRLPERHGRHEEGQGRSKK